MYSVNFGKIHDLLSFYHKPRDPRKGQGFTLGRQFDNIFIDLHLTMLPIKYISSWSNGLTGYLLDIFSWFYWAALANMASAKFYQIMVNWNKTFRKLLTMWSQYLTLSTVCSSELNISQDLALTIAALEVRGCSNTSHTFVWNLAHPCKWSVLTLTCSLRILRLKLSKMRLFSMYER